MKDIALLTCAVFTTEEEARRKFWIFLKSCEKFGAPEPHLYGIGHGFPGYRFMKLELQLEYLRTMEDEYVCYSDAWDAMLCAPWSELVSKYEDMGCPPLVTAAYTGFADSSKPDGFGDESEPNRYPHCGGWIGERKYMVDMFEQMLKLPNQTGDDCFNWRDGYLDGWFRPGLDSTCEIFQVTDKNCIPVIGHSTQLYNTATDSFPCILHLCGGHTDPETGKDYIMIPWAERLNII